MNKSTLYYCQSTVSRIVCFRACKNRAHISATELLISTRFGPMLTHAMLLTGGGVISSIGDLCQVGSRHYRHVLLWL